MSRTSSTLLTTH